LGEGGESAYQVSVVTDSQFESMEEKQGVARVALEFLEMDSSSQNSHGIRWPRNDFGCSSANFSGNGSTSGLNYTVGVQSTRGWLKLLVQQGALKILAIPKSTYASARKPSFIRAVSFPYPRRPKVRSASTVTWNGNPTALT